MFVSLSNPRFQTIQDARARESELGSVIGSQGISQGWLKSQRNGVLNYPAGLGMLT